MEALDVAALRAKHGRLLEADVGGHRLYFRPLTAPEANALARQINLAPELGFELALDACAGAFLGPPEQYAELSDSFALAFAADDGVCGRLLADADADARAIVKAGIARWKRSERNLGAQADALLALLSYRGGEVGEKQLAGALHVVQALDTVTALFKLHLNFFKSMASR